MKTQYVVAIATFVGIVIGGMAVQALHAQAKPRAYVVIEIDVVNQDAFFKEFVPVAVKTITDQGGKFLARGGKLVSIEGPAPSASEDKRLTLVEFENMEKAQATFASPSYSDVRTIGNKHAKFRIRWCRRRAAMTTITGGRRSGRASLSNGGLWHVATNPTAA